MSKSKLNRAIIISFFGRTAPPPERRVGATVARYRLAGGAGISPVHTCLWAAANRGRAPIAYAIHSHKYSTGKLTKVIS